jgi:hypothetical protein
MLPIGWNSKLGSIPSFEMRSDHMSRVGKFLQEHGVAAMLIAAIATLAASSQAAPPTAPVAAPKPASTKHVMSPYARAASQRERLGQPPVGHAPTSVQGMGKTRKSHTGAPSK